MNALRLPLLFLFVSPTLVHAADAIRPLNLELYPTLNAIGLEIAYEGDDNRNATAQFVWRKPGDKDWRNGVDLTVDRERRLLWGSIWPLEQGTPVEVRGTFSDPDAPALRPIESATTVRKMLLEPADSRKLHVS